MATAEAVKFYSTSRIYVNDDTGEIETGPFSDNEDPGAALDNNARHYAHDYRCGYEEALQRNSRRRIKLGEITQCLL